MGVSARGGGLFLEVEGSLSRGGSLSEWGSMFEWKGWVSVSRGEEGDLTMNRMTDRRL